MQLELLERMAREGFEEVTAIHDRRSGAIGFLAIHDTSGGPAFGGIRRWHYPEETEALRDCLRLALAMSYKCALADLAAGGGKLVLLERPRIDWDRAYQHVGALVERMGGRFYTGPDVGTGEAELAAVTRRTRYATDPGPAGPGQLPDATAEGVFRSIGAVLRHLDGSEDWGTRTVVVQGLGAVGSRLAARLREVGVRVIGSEIRSGVAEQVARRLGLELVDPSGEYDVPCDVFAPCALGGILHDVTLKRLRCRAVVGGANNILARDLSGERLAERGILFAPDFIVNAGALVRGALFHLEGRREPIERIGTRIAATLSRVLQDAAERGISPARRAVDLAEERLRERRRRADEFPRPTVAAPPQRSPGPVRLG